MTTLIDRLNPPLPEGWFSASDIATYRRLVAAVPDGGTIAELGVWKGRSLCSVADLVIAKKLRVVAVDQFADPAPEYALGFSVPGEVQRSFLEAVSDFRLELNVTLHPCSTDQAAAQVTETFDLIFIDADHRHPQVARDIRNWSRKLKPAGVLAGHDADEVAPALLEYFGDDVQIDGRIWIASALMTKDQGRMTRPYVFLTMPRHGHTAVYGAAFSHAMASAGACRVAFMPTQTSLLTHNFNLAWAQMLNDRKQHGFTHFAMLHSDVVPLPFGEPWLDKLIALLEERDCQMLSAVVPIKNDRGLTSTAIDNPKNPYAVRRLTMYEIFDRPPTWSEEGLLINTGCWAAKIGDWCEKVCFRQQDRIVRDRNGRYVAATIPEDWDFSRQLRKLGVKFMATRELAVQHELEMFHSKSPWGSWARDNDYFALAGDGEGETTNVRSAVTAAV